LGGGLDAGPEGIDAQATAAHCRKSARSRAVSLTVHQLECRRARGCRRVAEKRCQGEHCARLTRMFAVGRENSSWSRQFGARGPARISIGSSNSRPTAGQRVWRKTPRGAPCQVPEAPVSRQLQSLRQPTVGIPSNTSSEARANHLRNRDSNNQNRSLNHQHRPHYPTHRHLIDNPTDPSTTATDGNKPPASKPTTYPTQPTSTNRTPPIPQTCRRPTPSP
jgi:hypothetical protein